jgi:hypothetical protein
MFALMGLLRGAEKPWHVILDEAGSTWQEKWDNMAPKAPEMSPEGRIDFFSHILITNSSDVKASHRETYDKIQKILLDTPGHALYFGNLLKKNPRDAARYRWIGYLRNLPSPETIGVLGELLADESPRPELAPDNSNAAAYLAARPNCDQAALALAELLENPPVKKGNYNFPTDLVIWRQWYERVKAGRETFRLVGDPVDYTLRGPSKRGAVAPGPRDGKRNAGTGLETPSPDKALADKPGYLPYLVGVAFLLAAVFLFLKGKRGVA